MENYMELLKGLPNDLTRGFLLIRLLDKKAADAQAELEHAQEQALKRVEAVDKKANPTAAADENVAAALRDVRTRQRELVALHAEKAALVAQTQAVLQAYVDRLDDDIDKFKAELPADLPFEESGEIALTKEGKLAGRRGAGGGDEDDDAAEDEPAPPPKPKHKKQTGAGAGAAAAAATKASKANNKLTIPNPSRPGVVRQSSGSYNPPASPHPMAYESTV